MPGHPAQFRKLNPRAGKVNWRVQVKARFQLRRGLETRIGDSPLVDNSQMRFMPPFLTHQDL